MEPEPAYLHADRAATHDLLDRRRFADILADEVVAAPSSDGFVFSLMGPYGSGKTSVLGFVEEALAGRAEVLRFEPWLFSGNEALLGAFFEQLSTTLERSDREKLQRIAGAVRKYGQVVAPFLAATTGGLIAPVIAAVQQTAEGALAAADADLTEERGEIIAALREADQKIVVFIDDVDRLLPDEVREIVRLVKLVADFPNVVYVLAFDRFRVERSLGQTGDDGREYLEKIIQAPHDLPSAAPSRIREIAFGELGEALERRGIELSDEEATRWWGLFHLGVEPYLRTLRTARQWINVAPARILLAGSGVSPADVLALEALRIFEPDVYGQLFPVLERTTTEALALEGSLSPERKEKRAKEIVGIVEESRLPAVVTRLLVELLPDVSTLLTSAEVHHDRREARRTGRVASQDALAAYLRGKPRDRERIASLLTALANGEDLRHLLMDIPDVDLLSVLNELRDFSSEFPDTDVLAAGAVLLELHGRVAYLSGAFFSPPPGWQLMWVVEDLLATLAPDKRLEVVLRWAAEGTFTSRLWVLRWFGEQADRAAERRTERSVIPVETVGQLENSLLDDFAATAPAARQQEPDFWTLAAWLAEQRGQEKARAVLCDVVLLANIERLVQVVVREVGSARQVERTNFKWDTLTGILGEKNARETIIRLAETEIPDPGAAEAVQLAAEYASNRRFPSED